MVVSFPSVQISASALREQQHGWAIAQFGGFSSELEAELCCRHGVSMRSNGREDASEELQISLVHGVTWRGLRAAREALR